MTFSDLLTEAKKVSCDQCRIDTAVTLQLVVALGEMPKLLPILEKYFGNALKAPGTTPTDDALRYTQDYGGIRKDQTLYLKQSTDVWDYCMIWPWSDQVRATVTIFQEKQVAENERT